MSTSSASSGTPGVYSSDAPVPVVDNGIDPHRSQSDDPSGHAGNGESAPDVESTPEADELSFPIAPPGARTPNGLPAQVAATSSVSAEAQQGVGPGAAGASASGVGKGVAHTSAVSVVIGPDGAAAACEFGVVVAGPHGAAAASQAGVAAVGTNGAASSSNAANATSAAVQGEASNGHGNGNGNGNGNDHADLAERIARLEQENRELKHRLA